MQYGATFGLIRNIYWLVSQFNVIAVEVYEKKLKTNHKLSYRFDKIISDVELAIMLLTQLYV